MINKFALLLSIVILISFSVALPLMHASIGYEFKAQFETLPQNDEALEKWLLSQPGVIKAFVNREGDQIIGDITMVQRVIPREPKKPNVEEAFESLGYKKQVAFKWR